MKRVAIGRGVLLGSVFFFIPHRKPRHEKDYKYRWNARTTHLHLPKKADNIHTYKCKKGEECIKIVGLVVQS